MNMKTILLLILSCLPLFGATTYPVLTDNANRTFTGGATNMALLSGTNVFTGTNTFTAEKFFPANMLPYRILWSSPTNVFISNVSTSSLAIITNNGAFSRNTLYATGVIPPLLGSNSTIGIEGTIIRTNANQTQAAASFYIGPNTNWVGYAGGHSTTVGFGSWGQQRLITCANSLTNQMQGASFAQGAPIYSVTNFCDFSVSNTFYISLWTVTEHTNALVYGLRLIEYFAP